MKRTLLFIFFALKTSFLCFSEEIPIFLAADNNYAPYVATTMASILKNTKSFINFYVLSDGISNENKQKIANEKKYFTNFSLKFIDLNTDKLKNLEQTNMRNISKSTYSRLFIPELDVSKNISKAIYLDVDMIAKKDISLLYNENLDKYIVGAVSDDVYFEKKLILPLKDLSSIKNREYKFLKSITSPKHIYFNAGMLLINMDEWRKEKITQKTIETVNKIKDEGLLHDQTALNIVLNGKTKNLESKYNEGLHKYYSLIRKYKVNKKDLILKYAQHMSDAVVIHYTCDKPWGNKEVLFADEFWKMVSYTDFKEDLELKYKIRKKTLESIEEINKVKDRHYKKITLLATVIAIVIAIIIKRKKKR